MEDNSNITVTRLLQAVRAGDQQALNDLFPMVYQELRDQAHRQRGNWHGNHTLNTTAMVHEAYLKLVDQSQISWNNRAHFLGVAAKAMRHILIDYARKRQAQKRGGDRNRVSLHDLTADLLNQEGLEVTEERAEALVILEEALERLEKNTPRQVQIVECRFFGGMTIADTAAALGLSPATVKRDWTVAQAWLYREIQRSLAE